MWYAYLIGYGFSVLAEAILVKSIVESLWESITPGGEVVRKGRPLSWQGDVLARLEGVLYVACLQLGLAYFIGLWISLKVAGQWRRWTDPGDEQTGRPSGSTVFNIFMIGNALSVLYALVGFKFIEWAIQRDVVRIMWVAVTVMALTLVVWVMVPNRKTGMG